MEIAVVGAGYVGLVTGACFAELGNRVTCVDVNQQKIAKLKAGIMPIYEPGLETMVKTNMEQDRLDFSDSLALALQSAQVVFIAVGTPSGDDGSANIEYVREAAREIGRHAKQYCVVVDKSTVPVGMADQVKQLALQEITARGLNFNIDVVSNPEFLREGAAIEDFMRPDRVIIGLESDDAKRIMLDLYLPLLRTQENLYFMNVKDAEMTKYAANAMLATRISFMNEMAVLCEQMGVNVENVRKGIGADSRIGKQFLYPGCGYGGSCFPKDVRALIHMAEKHGVDPLILRAVEKRNDLQKNILPEKIKNLFGEDLSQVRVGIWGLSFKPGTDDMREAPSIVLIEHLINGGASIVAYDPVAMSVARQVMPAAWFSENKLMLAEHQYDAVKDVDALVLVTEWKSFSYPDLGAMKKLMRKPIVIDGRNQYDPLHMRDAGFEYEGIGICVTD